MLLITVGWSVTRNPISSVCVPSTGGTVVQNILLQKKEENPMKYNTVITIVFCSKNGRSNQGIPVIL